MFNENLKKIMDEQGISQAELSKMTGIGKPSISQYLSGKNTPSPKNVKTIADALECPVHILTDVTREEIPPQANEVRKLSLADAAFMCGKSKEFLAAWLQSGGCPFGHAQKGTGDKWDYLIPPRRLENWMNGIGMCDHQI